MKLKTKITEDVAKAIEYAISQPPSQEGMKILSEEALAKSLNIGVRRVRICLNLLEKKGVIARRRGSGTYVRRVPEFSEEHKQVLIESSLPLIDPKRLFVLDEVESISHGNNGRIFSMQLWCDLHTHKQINQSVFAGMSNSCSQQNGQLVIRALHGAGGISFSREDIKRQLGEVQVDGYFVEAHPDALKNADLFFEAGREYKVPVLFYYTGSLPLDEIPVFMINTYEAIQRAIRIFVNEGYKRIGFIALDRHMSPENASRVDDFELQAYEMAMGLWGLNYRNAIKVDQSAHSVMEKIREIIDGPTCPDALYVADDFVLTCVAEVLKVMDIKPGRDIGIITLGNRCHVLPEWSNWSCMEFDSEGFGRFLVEEMFLRIFSTTTESSSVSYHATWRPGETHQRAACCENINNVEMEKLECQEV